MSDSTSLHTPVLSEEVFEFLKGCEPFVDCTTGFGGHLKKILKTLSPEAAVLAIDRDVDMLKQTRELITDERITWVHGRFSEIDRHLKKWGRQPWAILADLGVSSWQVDQSSRGFSFQRAGPLDMRMDRTNPVTAFKLLWQLNEKQIREALWEQADERRAGAIAKAIKQALEKGELKSTLDLARVVRQVYGHYQGKDPATKTFQAIRRLVNQEEEELKIFLRKAPQCLVPGGRLAIISFHSGEDRQIKQAFSREARQGSFKVLTSKPIQAGLKEVKQNPRSRSAKLRILEKVA